MISLFYSWFASAIIVSGNQFPDDSIYQLNSQWITHEGKKISLSDLSGVPLIASMVFLGCQYSCPITIRDMREVENKVLRKNKKAQFRMVLISIDPETDTPEQMMKYIQAHSLDPKRWLIITSTPENIRELAAVLGFSYRPDEAMKFAHSMLTWIFNTNGVVQLTRESRKPSVDEMVQKALSFREGR
jgi:protein SCO1/2